MRFGTWRRWFSLLSVTLFALVFLAACGGKESPELEDVTPIPSVPGAPDFSGTAGSPAAGGQAAPTTTSAAAPAGGQAAQQPAAERVRLTAGDIYFDPTQITVPVGGVIELVNTGGSPHNFAIEGYNDEDPVDIPIGGDVIEWTVPDDLAPGAYTFYCEIPGHRAAGMEGTITIVPAQAAAPAGAAPGATPGATPAATPGATPVAGTPAAATPMAGTPAATPQAAAPEAAGPTTVRLEGGDIYFNPTELTVKAGDVIELVNIGVQEHTFAVEGYNDDAPVDMPAGGEVIQWTVPADLAPGQYIFYCTIPGHRAAGMQGTLTVTG